MIEYFLTAAVVASIPLLYGALGGIISEKSGMLNLGIEGIMITGAISSYLLAMTTENIFITIIGGVLAGVLINLIYGFLTITLKANQSVTGFTLTTLGIGLANTLGRPYANISVPDKIIVFCQPIKLPLLGDIPYIGTIFFNQSIFVYFAYFLVVIIYLIFKYTKIGLYLTAVGDGPAVAESVSINVDKVRYLCVIASGAIIALGGEFLSLAYLSKWQPSITMGRGWIAVALVIFSAWKPIRAFFGSLLFGALMIVQFYFKLPISSYFVVMAPYIFTIIVLVMLSSSKKGKNKPPASLGVPHYKETR